MAKQTTSTPRDGASVKPGAVPARRPAAGGGSGAGSRGVSPLSFFQESVAELRKVTWPTRQETLNLTGAVIAMTVGMAAFLGAIDAALDWLVKPILGQ